MLQALISQFKNKFKKMDSKDIFYLRDSISLTIHKGPINKIANFPSGNFVTVSVDKSIQIFDINLQKIQCIEEAHDAAIMNVEIKDEDNFVTCSCDESIKTWIKKENLFKLNKIIKNAHENNIHQVIYYSNNFLISCSQDDKIKIWEEINNNYQNITTLDTNFGIFSLMLLNDKNILVSSGKNGTNFWNLNTFEMIMYCKETECIWPNLLCRTDEDIILTESSKFNSLKVISISEKKKIKEIKHPTYCYAIYLIKDKGMILVGGQNLSITIYRNDNYECIQTIKQAHNNSIVGFNQLKNGKIISYGLDSYIKIWSLNK